MPTTLPAPGTVHLLTWVVASSAFAELFTAVLRTFNNRLLRDLAVPHEFRAEAARPLFAAILLAVLVAALVHLRRSSDAGLRALQAGCIALAVAFTLAFIRFVATLTGLFRYEAALLDDLHVSEFAYLVGIALLTRGLLASRTADGRSPGWARAALGLAAVAAVVLLVGVGAEELGMRRTFDVIPLLWLSGLCMGAAAWACARGLREYERHQPPEAPEAAWARAAAGAERHGRATTARAWLLLVVPVLIFLESRRMVGKDILLVLVLLFGAGSVVITLLQTLGLLRAGAAPAPALRGYTGALLGTTFVLYYECSSLARGFHAPSSLVAQAAVVLTLPALAGLMISLATTRGVVPPVASRVSAVSAVLVLFAGSGAMFFAFDERQREVGGILFLLTFGTLMYVLFQVARRMKRLAADLREGPAGAGDHGV